MITSALQPVSSFVAEGGDTFARVGVRLLSRPLQAAPLLSGHSSFPEIATPRHSTGHSCQLLLTSCDKASFALSAVLS